MDGMDHDLSAAVPPQQLALAIDRALTHTGELACCDLPLPDGRTLPVLTHSEVVSWLEGLRARAHAGERL